MPLRRPSRHALPAVIIAWLAGHALAADTRLERLERQFRDLPMEARRLTGPLFWLHGDESRDRLELYVGKVAEGGNGCFTAESRPHNDWLGKGWYRDLAICLEAAKKNDLKMWIFDERWWPSGEVGGRVPESFATRFLDAQSREISGPAVEHIEVPSNVVAVIAGRVTDGEAVDGASLVDIGRGSRPGRPVMWHVPEGRWKLMTFTWRRGDRVRGNWLVDGASRDAVKWYLDTVYQPHYDHFKADFGRTIPGFFYDEPETPGDWGTEVIPMLRERGIDWKRALVAWKFTLAGEEQVAARYQYQDAFAEAWGRTLYGGISEWCRDHHVTSIGHFLEHHHEYLNPRLCAGNMFQLMKYTDMGGIDVVFRQFVWGRREGGDLPLWQTPKLGSSISHVYGKRNDLTMVETFGARGQDLTYPEMKWWTDHLQVSGVNFTIPHSFNPRAPNDTDCPPYFYNGGFEPRWPLYRVFADYTSRLSLLLSGGRHVAPVALLYLGNSAHVGKYVPPEPMSAALQDALFDCDWMPYDVFEEDARLSRREIRLYQERYRVLVVPPVEVIPHGTLRKAKDFFDRGGLVIGYGFLPTKSATLGRTAADITALRESIWGAAPVPSTSAVNTNRAGGRAYFLPERPSPTELQRALTGDAGVHPTLEVVEGQTDNWLHVLHRQKDDRDIFFLCNQVTGSTARTFKLRIQARGEPECWDAMRNEITAPACTRIDRETVEVALTLEPLESVALVFASRQRTLPLRADARAAAAGASVIPVARKPCAVATSPAPAQPESTLPPLLKILEGGTWIWHPEGQPAISAPPGTRYFRKTLLLPDDRKISSARFVLTADNEFHLNINGRNIGTGGTQTDAWRTPVELDVADALRSGTNLISVTAVNTTDHPSAAGLIGRLTVRFESGAPLVAVTDASWESVERENGDWRAAKVIAKFGDAPWGRLGDAGRQGGVTRSPVAAADPFDGSFEIPSTIDLTQTRVLLETSEPTPEAAARISINGTSAGGFIGAPYRLDVTRQIKIGANEVRIEPFAPTQVNVILQPHREP